MFFLWSYVYDHRGKLPPHWPGAEPVACAMHLFALPPPLSSSSFMSSTRAVRWAAINAAKVLTLCGVSLNRVLVLKQVNSMFRTLLCLALSCGTQNWWHSTIYSHLSAIPVFLPAQCWSGFWPCGEPLDKDLVILVVSLVTVSIIRDSDLAKY